MVVSDIEAIGSSLTVISPQLQDYSKQVSKKHKLTFNVLSDHGNQVASMFGLTFTLPAELRKIYTDFGIDLEKFNGDDSWTLPMPGRFIINRQGTIISANVHPDYTIRPEPADIIKILQS